MTKQEFLAAAARAAVAVSRGSGFPPGITAAQAALESSFGQSRLSLHAHNYFGIKAHGNFPRVHFVTCEHAWGSDVHVCAEFALYTSMEECFADRDRIIATVACYTGARASRSDPETFARALAEHWATDPQYAEKLLSVYRDNHLDELDRKFVNSSETQPQAAAFTAGGAPTLK